MLIDDSENGYLAMDAAVLIEAFEDTLKVLGSTDRSCSATLVAADHIIAIAKAGERDPVRLRDLTINAIRDEQRAPIDRLARLDSWVATRLANWSSTSNLDNSLDYPGSLGVTLCS